MCVSAGVCVCVCASVCVQVCVCKIRWNLLLNILKMCDNLKTEYSIRKVGHFISRFVFVSKWKLYLVIQLNVQF